MEFEPRPCAEFPNDNPDLHSGAVWVCSWPRASARAVVRAKGAARLGEMEGEVVVAECWSHPERKPCQFDALQPWSEHLDVPDTGALAWFAGQESVEPLAPCLTSPLPPEVVPLLAATPDLPAVSEVEDPFVRDLWLELHAAASEPLPEYSEEGSPTHARAEHLSPAPVSEMRLFRPEQPNSESHLLSVEPLELDLSPLPRDSAWVAFTTQLSRYLLDHGAIRAASLIVPLLEGERVNLRSLSSAARRELAVLSVCEETSNDFFTDPIFQREAKAFYQLFLNRAETNGARVWVTHLVFALLGGSVPLSQIHSDFGNAGHEEEPLFKVSSHAVDPTGTE